MRNPPSTGAVPFEGFECDNNGDCLFFGVANIHWYLVDHDEADEDLRKEMPDIHHETNPETSHRRQLDPKTTLGVIHYVIREFPVEPPPLGHDCPVVASRVRGDRGSGDGSVERATRLTWWPGLVHSGRDASAFSGEVT